MPHPSLCSTANVTIDLVVVSHQHTPSVCLSVSLSLSCVFSSGCRVFISFVIFCEVVVVIFLLSWMNRSQCHWNRMRARWSRLFSLYFTFHSHLEFTFISSLHAQQKRIYFVCVLFFSSCLDKKNYIDLNLAFIVWKVISRWGCQAQRVTLRHAERSVLMLKLI